MTAASQQSIKAAGKSGQGRGQHRAGDDGQIKGPGPLGSMALMVLEKFRDLALDLGPGISNFSGNISGLSGTQAPGARP